uniref:NADH dehydrogenase subunit 4L n=1 Tax=Cryptocephalus dimidiatipennis TaxID=2978450 RepID=UPI0021CC97D1|nr:NADH dehydrogenase subunit 4L [Cryptocephalus dimidiatipennis]UWV18206.1 NADH dehydrogenase subunit 4L [Cryptocephalus dimidiatipennis]
MMIYFYMIIFMFVTGLFSFFLFRRHFLMMLLSLEFLVLSLYMGMFIFLTFYTYEYFFMIVYLTMSVCEGTLGLSMLVMMIRNHGNDYVLSMSSLW